MYERLDYFEKRMKEQFGEIKPFIIKRRETISNWRFASSKALFPPVQGWTHINSGYEWNRAKSPVWFETDLFIEAVEPGEDIFLSVWTGGESLVFVDGQPFGELNLYHKQLNVQRFADASTHTVDIQSVPHGLFGEKSRETRLERAFLIVTDKAINDFFRLLDTTLDLCVNTDDKDLSDSLRELLEETMVMTEIPRDTETYLSSIRDNALIRGYIDKKYSSEETTVSAGNHLPGDLRQKMLVACQYLEQRLEELQRRFPKRGKIYLTGHAHIDYAWLWPVEETKRKIPRTFANALSIIDRTDDFIFVQSSAQMYKDLKESYPSLYKRVKEAVKNRRWIPAGGAWVESDCNIPSPESLARQFYYGQTFFREEFGKYSRVAWLPDVFGFSWVLPQICKESGIDSFFTTKLSWNEKNPMAHDTFIWRGIDGSRVIYRSFENEEGYNARVEPKTAIQNWQNYKDRTVVPFSMMTFGYGDGGGGPSDEMIGNYQAMKKLPGLPEMEMLAPEAIFNETAGKEAGLPVHDDELYLEFHRGTLTSQARTKKFHKQCEDELFYAELIAALIDSDDRNDKSTIDACWEGLLRNEFHDILPGSSIKDVYEDAEAELKSIKSTLSNVENRALKKHFEKYSEYITLFNISEYPVSPTVELEGKPCKLRSPDGTELIPVKTFDDKNLYASESVIEPFGFLRLKRGEAVNVNHEIKSASVSNDIMDKKPVLENEYLWAMILPDGTIKVFDKKAKRYLFNGSGNQLKISDDVPMFWDAWEIDSNIERYSKALNPDSIKMIEANTIRTVVEVFYKLGKTQILQRYILKRASNSIDIVNEIDWHHRRTLLRAEFPVDVLSRTARYDLGAGYIERKTTRNSDYEKARFEVPAQRWVDISERDFGVSIINNGKYGHSVEESTIKLSLLRSPVNPDLIADEGKHQFVYSIVPHSGSDLLQTLKKSREMNRGVRVISGKSAISGSSFLHIPDKNLHLMAFKRSKDGYVLRLSENLGSRGRTTITINSFQISNVYLSNILEEKIKTLKHDTHSFDLDYEPFGIQTILLERRV